MTLTMNQHAAIGMISRAVQLLKDDTDTEFNHDEIIENLAGAVEEIEELTDEDNLAEVHDNDDEDDEDEDDDEFEDDDEDDDEFEDDDDEDDEDDEDEDSDDEE